MNSKKSTKKSNKVALISGTTGQDGSYLAEILLEKGYEVHGIIRRTSTITTERIDHLYTDPHEDTKFFLHYADLGDSLSLERVISEVKPDEIYNLGSQSHVRVSFDIPEYTADVTGLGALRFLEAIRRINPKIKYYQASSSEMFGASPPPQNEKTPFHPRSPYGCAKVFAYHTTVNYRESYGIFACNGILFNHESERRGETFVTRKITKGLANILADRQQKLYLGNLDAKRDWGHSKDYMEAAWLMLQQKEADDYVIGTGQTHSVREFLEKAFSYRGLDWKKYVVIDPKYYRPAEVDVLLADPSKAIQKLKWQPKITFDELVERMVDYDTSGLK